MADLDLEEELLAVAGKSSRGENRKRNRGRASSLSEDENDVSDVEEDLFASEDSDSQRVTRQNDRGAKKARKGRNTRVERREDDDDDDEGGYASDLYIDEEDRKKLLAMRELDREMILAERAEQRDQEKARQAMLKQVRGGKQADQADLRSSGRRTKTQQRTDTAMRELAARREQKERAAPARRTSDDDLEGARPAGPSKRASREQARGKGKKVADWSDDDSSATSASGRSRPPGSDDDYEEPASGSQSPMSSASASLQHSASSEERGVARASEEAGVEVRGKERHEHRGRHEDVFDNEDVDERVQDEAGYSIVLNIQLKRTQLEAWLDNPHLAQVVPGCVIRVPMNETALNFDTCMTQTNYAMMVVDELKEDGGPPYKFGNKQAKTTKYLIALHGDRKRAIQLSCVSNQPITIQEFDSSNKLAEKAKRLQVQATEVDEVLKKLEDLRKHRYTVEEVREMIRNKAKAQRDAGMKPFNWAQEKARLIKEREMARQNGDNEDAEKFDREIRELEMQKMCKGGQRAYGMRGINKRNITHNFQLALNNASNRIQGAGEKERKGGVDPFSRRATRPLIYWNTKKGTGEEAQDLAAEAAAAETARANKAAIASAKLTSRQARMDPAELIRQLDIVVDTSHLTSVAAAASANMTARRLLGLRWRTSLSRHTNYDLAGKTVLTVADWKRRAGFM